MFRIDGKRIALGLEQRLITAVSLDIIDIKTDHIVESIGVRNENLPDFEIAVQEAIEGGESKFRFGNLVLNFSGGEEYTDLSVNTYPAITDRFINSDLEMLLYQLNLMLPG